MTYTLSPRQLLDLRFGVSRVASGRFPYNHNVCGWQVAGQPNQCTLYSAYGIPYPISSGVGSVSLNTQAISDVSTLGAEPDVSIYQNPFTVDPKVSYRIEHAHHSIEVGYELLALKTPTAWQSPVYGEDSITSTTTLTTPPATPIPNTPCGSGTQIKTQSILNPKSQWLRLGGGQYVGNVFNSNLVFAPPDSAPYGTSPRNSIRFVPIWNLDTGVAKDFHIRNEGVLQFRAEAFNTPNKTNWNSPDMDSTSGVFGYISSAAASRQFQFSLRYSY
jgi:hypothetical protein